MEWNVQQQGPRAIIETTRANDNAGLYKAYAIGPHGRLLLGTLAPENDQLSLRRTLSIDSLKRQGVWPIQTVETILSCPFHQDDAPPKSASILWSDVVLRQCAQKLPHHTLRQEKNGFSLSFPFDPSAPFPLTPAFCFARVSGSQLIFSFQNGGVPYISSPAGQPNRAPNEQRRDTHGKPDHQGAERPGRPTGL